MERALIGVCMFASMYVNPWKAVVKGYKAVMVRDFSPPPLLLLKLVTIGSLERSFSGQ